MASDEAKRVLVDSMERVRDERVDPIGNSEEFSGVIAVLAMLSSDVNLRDALLIKAMDPGLDERQFGVIADNDPQAVILVESELTRALNQSSYNTYQIMYREYHNDIPLMLDQLALRIEPEISRSGVYAVCA